MNTCTAQDIPPEILEQAIAWSVKLRSGSADDGLLTACRAWRARDQNHEHAWQMLHSIEQEFCALAASAPQLACKTLDVAGEQRSVINPSRRRALQVLGLGAGGVVLSYLLLEQQNWLNINADYATVTGERRNVTLADGTQLTLNTDGAVNVLFNDTHRLIVLRHGEISIQTGTDSAFPGARRPFWVQTPQVRLEALGTEFFVRREDGHTRPAGTTPVAQPGQEFLIDRDGPRLITDAHSDMTSWAAIAVAGCAVIRQWPSCGSPGCSSWTIPTRRWKH